MPQIVFQKVDVLTDGGSQEGRLALANGELVAVFVRVDEKDTRSDGTGCAGWYREAGFGPCSDLFAQPPPVFTDLESAEVWIDERITTHTLQS